MENEKRVETIARGVCIKNGAILLCYGKNGGVSYHPGGHIEFREKARTALVREIEEEMGLPSKAGRFLGCCENAFVQKGQDHAEINLIFELDVPDASPEKDPVAKESWIGFRWIPLADLEKSDLEPAVLRSLVADWVKNPGKHVESGDRWI